MVRRTGTCIARTAVLLTVAAWAGGCEEYSQDSAQAVVQSARQMVTEGRADRLPTLIYAESKRERRVLREVGSLLGHVQDLAVAVNKAFPAEVAALRARAEAAEDAADRLRRRFGHVDRRGLFGGRFVGHAVVT